MNRRILLKRRGRRTVFQPSSTQTTSNPYFFQGYVSGVWLEGWFPESIDETWEYEQEVDDSVQLGDLQTDDYPQSGYEAPEVHDQGDYQQQPADSGQPAYQEPAQQEYSRPEPTSYSSGSSDFSGGSSSGSSDYSGGSGGYSGGSSDYSGGGYDSGSSWG